MPQHCVLCAVLFVSTPQHKSASRRFETNTCWFRSAQYPNWMATNRDKGVPAVTGAGDPDGLIYAPPVCDTTLQAPTSTWLYDPFVAKPRELADLKQLYHQSVGRSCGLELNLAPQPNGTLAPSFVARLREFGAWIKSCWGMDSAVPGRKAPVGVATPSALAPGQSVKVALNGTADRVVIKEDLSNGQLIRSFRVTDASGATVYAGTSLGHKHLAVFNRTVSGGSSITVTISSAGGPLGAPTPRLTRVAAYSTEGC